MVKEVINNKGKLPVDYLRDRPYVGELVETLQKKFPTWQIQELIDFLRTTDFAVVKKVSLVPTRTY